MVLGVSDNGPDAGPHARHSMVLVPMDTPGVERVRNIPIMHHRAPEGHCELVFRNVRVPAGHLLGEEGQGFRKEEYRRAREAPRGSTRFYFPLDADPAGRG